MDEATSGYCAQCYQPNATVGVGEDAQGEPVFVHQKCETAYLGRVLGRNMVDITRTQDERAARYGRS